MRDDIVESDIYGAFRKKSLEAGLKPDEKIVTIQGCPTVIKKNWFERKISIVKDAFTGRHGH